jgi:predicted phosphoribosyltransferase
LTIPGFEVPVVTKVVDKAVILVDDGISTFFTFRMAVTVLRLRRAAQIVIAVPIAAPPPCLSC